jgi:hypothetical protein
LARASGHQEEQFGVEMLVPEAAVEALDERLGKPGVGTNPLLGVLP